MRKKKIIETKGHVFTFHLKKVIKGLCDISLINITVPLNMYATTLNIFREIFFYHTCDDFILLTLLPLVKICGLIQK